jgi:hypothetical protein
MRRLSDEERRTKLQILEELKEAMNSQLDPLEDPMAEVTVAADDPEGLSEGLEMAQDLVEDEELMEPLMAEDSMLEDEMPMDDMVMMDEPEMSRDEILEEMERLKAMLDRAE